MDAWAWCLVVALLVFLLLVPLLVCCLRRRAPVSPGKPVPRRGGACAGRPEFPVHEPANSAVLVTGTSSGIGRALAAQLVAHGYTVFGTVRKQKDADELQAELTERFVPVLCDVADAGQVAEMSKVVQHRLAKPSGEGLRLVGVVNNAGTMCEVQDMDSTSLQKMLDTNVLGPYRVAEAFMPLLLESGGRLVLIGSYFGSMTTARHTEYAMTKYAMEALNDGLRRRYSSQGLAVSLVKPGNIRTQMTQDPTRESGTRGESGPEVVGEAVIDALGSNRPLERYYPGYIKGRSTWFICHMFDLLPERWADTLF